MFLWVSVLRSVDPLCTCQAASLGSAELLQKCCQRARGLIGLRCLRGQEEIRRDKATGLRVSECLRNWSYLNVAVTKLKGWRALRHGSNPLWAWMWCKDFEHPAEPKGMVVASSVLLQSSFFEAFTLLHSLSYFNISCWASSDIDLGYVWVTHWMQVVTRTETLPVGWVLLAVSTDGLAMQYLKLSPSICLRDGVASWKDELDRRTPLLPQWKQELLYSFKFRYLLQLILTRDELPGPTVAIAAGCEGWLSCVGASRVAVECIALEVHCA